MRVLKVVLTSLLAMLALAGGLFLTAVVATVSVLVLLTRRLLASSRASTRTDVPARVEPARSASTDIIEVSATEVPAELPPR